MAIDSKHRYPATCQEYDHTNLRVNLINALGQAASILGADVFLKGSVVRGDAPYGDADLLVVADPEVKTDFPAQILDTDISVTQIGKEIFKRILDTTPRDWYILCENIPLQIYDPEVGELLESAKTKLFNSRSADYLLYLAIEHEIYGRNLNLDDGDYFCYKRMPGSKRAIMRGLFMSKILYPQYSEVLDTQTLTVRMAQAGHLPVEVAEDIPEILEMLQAGRYGAEWEERTARMEEWSRDVMEEAYAAAVPVLPPEYTDAALAGVYSRMSEDTLQQIADVRTDQRLPYRQWTLDLILAANPTTPPEKLLKLWQESYEAYERRLICRYLVRHPAFPREILDPNSINDFHLKCTLERASRLGAVATR